MSEVERAWLAGVIDGEGSIGLYLSWRSRPSEGRKVIIQASNTVRPFMERVREVIGAGTITERLFQPLSLHKGRKPIYHFTLCGSERGLKVLRQIMPYLIVKKTKAEGIIKELDEHPFGRWAATTPEARAKQGERMKKTWKDPTIRQRRVDGLKLYWARKRAEVPS